MLMKRIQEAELRSYLSPRLRQIYDSMKALMRRRDMARMLVMRGVLPPSKLRAEIMELTERMIGEMLRMVRTQFKEEPFLVKEFEKSVSELEKKKDELKAKLFVSMRDDIAPAQVMAFLDAVSTFIDSNIYPAFEYLSKTIALTPEKIWEAEEKIVADEMFKRMGIKPPEEEEETFGKFGEGGEE